LCFGREIGIPEKTTGKIDHCIETNHLNDAFVQQVLKDTSFESEFGILNVVAMDYELKKSTIR
jgi:hypothetical protein